MNCCPHCAAIDNKFDRERAERDLRRYHRKGPDPTTAEILRLIRKSGQECRTLLDVGGGIGVIAFELLEQGVETCTLAEAASGCIETARQEVERRGALARARFVQGDFVEIADRVPAADVVTLDRVVCCYPDYVTLLSSCAARCTELLVVSYPRDRWYVRIVMGFENLVRRVRRDPFRTFVHPAAEMHRVLADAGLTLGDAAQTLVWRTASFRRGPATLESQA